MESVNSDLKMTDVIFRSYYYVLQRKGFRMESKFVRGKEKNVERSRQREESQKESCHDR